MVAPADLTRIERLALGQIRPRRQSSAGMYSRANHRCREIDKLVTARFGKLVPADIDVTPYLTAIAYAANATDPDIVEAAIQGWCGRFAPHLLSDFSNVFEPIRRAVEGRRWNLADHDVAHLLAVDFAERQALGLVTIGACDLSKVQLRERVAADRRERERIRLAEKRATRRSELWNREQWLDANRQERGRPWEALGVSRSTWFTRRKTGLLQPAQDVGQVALQGAHQSVGQVVLHIGLPTGGSDIPVQSGSIMPSLLDMTGNSGDGAKPPAAGCVPHHRQQETVSDARGRRPALSAGLRGSQLDLFAAEGINE